MVCVGNFPFAPAIPGTSIEPSGDTTGVKDANTIISALGSYDDVLMAQGEWHVSDAVLNLSGKWLRGSGFGTLVNVPASATAFTISGVSQFLMSDMAFSLGSGSLGLQVNGSEDSHYHDLYFSGSSAAGAVSVNGDDSTEQHWSDIMIRGCGGTAFAYKRTTTTDTGGMYLDRVRIVSPPSTATGGFLFTSSASSTTPVAVFLDQCVADSYYADAIHFDNVASSRVSSSWFTLNSAASGGSPIHVTNGYDVTFDGCYTSNTISGGYDVLIDDSAHEIQVGGSHVFDGASGTTALGLSAAGGNFILGDYYSYCGTLTDTPEALSVSQVSAPRAFWTNGSGGSTNTLVLMDSSAPSDAFKYIRNSAGQFQIVNGAFTSVIMALTDSGNAVFSGTVTTANGFAMTNAGTTTTAPSAGSAGALPATPAGYLTVSINGTDHEIAYY